MTDNNSTAILRESGLKVTQQRLLLLNTILDSNPVFSTASLEKKVKGKMDGVTVYRILAAFLQHGIVREVLTGDVTRFYELSYMDDPVHPHFVCKQCKRIICLESLSRKDFLTIRNYSKNNKVQDMSIQLTGICSECRKFKDNS